MGDLSNWQGCEPIEPGAMAGDRVAIISFDTARHGQALWQALGGLGTNQLLRYFTFPDFADGDQFTTHLATLNQGDWRTNIITDAASSAVLGMANYMHNDAKNGVVEIGGIAHGPAMAGTAAATEAQYLMMKKAFETYGYRRYEWKCHNANQASKKAAVRLGFTFEGVFRQHSVCRGANRDSAWYSVIDSEWPLVKQAFEAWLDPANFDAHGSQIRGLMKIREALS